MLTQLDTLIGFVVVMSIVSLLIMVGTQAVSSFLGLRGKNLADALEVLFHKIEPEIDASGCRQLIDDVLTSPVISDSMLRVRKAEGFFTKVLPFARKLRHGWMRATAIRPDELFEMLVKRANGPYGATMDRLLAMDAQVAGIPGAAPEALAKATAAIQLAVAALATGTVPAGGTPDASPGPADVPGAVKAAVDAFAAAGGVLEQRFPPAATAIGAVNAEWKKLETDAERRAALAAEIAANRIAKIVAATDAAVGAAEADYATQTAHFEKWFNSAQDRAQQWFSMHARVVTVIGAILAAFVLQLDTVQMVRLLSANPDLRAKLVARADALGRQAHEVSQPKVTPADQQVVLAKIRADHPGWDVPAGLDHIPGDEDLGQVVAGMTFILGSNEHAGDIVHAYEQGIQTLKFNGSLADLEGVLKDYNASTLELMPSPYPVAANPEWPSHKLSSLPFQPWIQAKGEAGKRIYWSWPLHHLVGIVLSAAFLSLGAPFWFNLLNQLSSLRPALADAIDGQPKQGAVPAPEPK
jgi:hypothetical protein